MSTPDTPDAAMASPMRGLYGITPEWDDTAQLVAAVEAAARGGLRAVQLRRKLATPAKRLEQARALRAACGRLGVVLIINDDWRLALDAGADGVHLGRDDGDIAQARQAGGPALLIGASCYNEPERARAALAAGADHVAFGAVFDSPTKPAAVRAPLSCLADAHRLRLPGASRPTRPAIVAIGGITPANAGQAVAAGADALAVITALFGASDIEAAARAFARAWTADPAGNSSSKA
ncbi:MAG: thiamine phosphate synthase [Pigmentiphaga sp.]|uniref:thiamine phosphate synthase n=1 Tax=Pigmentiphaga sp. TaxID=1977564 RepID=UPI0029AC3ABA|nr:thiamine phosphate synthase [Pigmentiphaga sp.]MDX3906814.1 thiamine phosphate synthase [Pigmentiphaga sp.]